MPERQNNPEVDIVDSELTFEEAIKGTKAPEEIVEQLTIINIDYLSFDGKIHRGQLVVNKKLEKEIREIFAELLELEFPIQQIKPIVEYDWSDDRSMIANNSSSFNYRNIEGTDNPSLHSFGRAIDINPFLNPVVEGGNIKPSGATHKPGISGTIDEKVVEIFTSRGWVWGGNWNDFQDYHHFQKRA